MRQVRIQRLGMSSPDDVSGLRDAIAAGTIEPKSIVAIVGKTEGNGCVNDFTRAFAVRSLRNFLADYRPDADDVLMVMSGGCEGALVPHLLVFEQIKTQAGSSPALAIGVHKTVALPTEALGRMGQIKMVAAGVLSAMGDAGIQSADDVHFVQIKCPLLTAERIAAAERQGKTVATRDTLKSMALSRGASALGVGVALGEIKIENVEDQLIGRDFSVWSGRASTSGGVELLGHEIVVLGMSAAWAGDLMIDHCVMTDQIDIEPVRSCLNRLGFSTAAQLQSSDQERLVALLAKAEAGSTGRLRGRRHTMLDDSDISSTRHARAFVGGALASVVGHGEIFVSGGAEHQGPDGGGPVAVIAKRPMQFEGVLP